MLGSKYIKGVEKLDIIKYPNLPKLVELFNEKLDSLIDYCTNLNFKKSSYMDYKKGIRAMEGVALKNVYNFRHIAMCGNPRNLNSLFIFESGKNYHYNRFELLRLEIVFSTGKTEARVITKGKDNEPFLISFIELFIESLDEIKDKCRIFVKSYGYAVAQEQQRIIKESYFKRSEKAVGLYPETHPEIFKNSFKVERLLDNDYRVVNEPEEWCDDYDIREFCIKNHIFLIKDKIIYTTVDVYWSLSEEVSCEILDRLSKNSNMVLTITKQDSDKYSMFMPNFLPKEVCISTLRSLYSVNKDVFACGFDGGSLHETLNYLIRNDGFISLTEYKNSEALRYYLDYLLNNSNRFNIILENSLVPSNLEIMFGVRIINDSLELVLWVEHQEEC